MAASTREKFVAASPLKIYEITGDAEHRTSTAPHADRLTAAEVWDEFVAWAADYGA